MRATTLLNRVLGLSGTRVTDVDPRSGDRRLGPGAGRVEGPDTAGLPTLPVRDDGRLWYPVG